MSTAAQTTTPPAEITARRTLRLVNDLGLHARAAAKLVALTNRFTADIQVEFEGESIYAKSIMGLLTLSAPHGSELVFAASGSDAEAALDAVAALVATGFGEGVRPIPTAPYAAISQASAESPPEPAHGGLARDSTGDA